MAELKLALCHLVELDNHGARGIAVPIGESRLEIFLVRKDTELRGYFNRCPHTGASLEWTPDQFLDEHKAFIMCANHAALFEIETGLCVAGPCINQRLQSIPTSVDDGVVYIVYRHVE